MDLPIMRETATKLTAEEYTEIEDYYAKAHKRTVLFITFLILWAFIPLILLIYYYTHTDNTYSTFNIFIKGIIITIWICVFVCIIIKSFQSAEYKSISKIRNVYFNVSLATVIKDNWVVKDNRQVSYLDIFGKEKTALLINKKHKESLVGKQIVIIDILDKNISNHAFYFKKRNTKKIV